MQASSQVLTMNNSWSFKVIYLKDILGVHGRIKKSGDCPVNQSLCYHVMQLRGGI
jgi:hypothetical protein